METPSPPLLTELNQRSSFLAAKKHRVYDGLCMFMLGYPNIEVPQKIPRCIIMFFHFPIFSHSVPMKMVSSLGFLASKEPPPAPETPSAPGPAAAASPEDAPSRAEASSGVVSGKGSLKPEEVPLGKMLQYPLVNIQKAIENGHRNRGFSH